MAKECSKPDDTRTGVPGAPFKNLSVTWARSFLSQGCDLAVCRSNRWLKLKLVGVKANRVAIGARIKVALQTPHGPRELHRVVSIGGSFGSNPLRQEIGLGDATAIAAVDIRWPGSDTRQTLTGLEPNHSYEIREGDPIAVPLKLHPVDLQKHAPARKGASQPLTARPLEVTAPGS